MDLALSIAFLKAATEERSGRGAPLATQTPMKRTSEIGEATGDAAAARDQILRPGMGDNRDIGRLAVRQPLLQLRRRAKCHAEPISSVVLNAGASCSNDVFIAVVLKTVSAFGKTKSPSGSSINSV